MGFLDDLYQEHGSSVQQRVSSELGIPADKAARALPTVAPIILAGLKREMDKGGPGHIEAHLEDLNKNGIPDDEEVGGLLGGKGKEASALMASQLGISSAAASKLIPMLAPLIIGMLMKKGGGGAASGAGGAAAGGGGGALGGLASILDRNGDGSILDDLSGLIAKGGVGDLLAGGGASKSGCLGSILGALLGGKK
ncbi:MAG: uncharacterized protein JWL81_2591 [Verrucomicrobiales bacterium]|nr:uncharacterized protein [Verrucomicrobiales bacterium]